MIQFFRRTRASPFLSLRYPSKRKNILLTGPPRCSKSTLGEKLTQRLNRALKGFFTREIKESGRRPGFWIISLDGREGILADEDSKSKVRVGKYGVNLDQLDQIAVPSITPPAYSVFGVGPS